FFLLLIAVHQVLPHYARKFGLRGQVRRHVQLVEAEHLPVICYPRRWDSVSFYLGRNDVCVYPSDRRAELMAELQARTHALLFVKPDESLQELLPALPAELEFVPDARSGIVTAGLIRPRSCPLPVGRARR